MESTTTPVPVKEGVAELKTCKCGQQFPEGLGFIDGLDAMSFRARGDQFDPKYPLSPAEVIQQEMCQACARCGSEVMSTTFVVNKVQELIKNNAEAIVREAEQRHRREATEQTQSLAYALRRPDDKGLVNQTFAEAPVRKERHKKGRQYKGGPKIKRDPNAPKNYGTTKVQAVSSSKKKNKGKNKDGEDGSKKKGR